LDVEDVFIMSENHIEQLKAFFISLAGDKVGGDFGLENCQEPLDDSGTDNKDIRNTVGDDFNEEDYKFEDTKHVINEDMIVKVEVEEEPLSIVSKNSDDVRIASHAVYINLNFSLLIISILFFYNNQYLRNKYMW
jgi:hypothetical protein